MEGGPTATDQRAPLTARRVIVTVLPAGGATTRSPACQVSGASRGRSPAPLRTSRGPSAQKEEELRLAPAQGQIEGLLGRGEVPYGPQLDEPGQGGPDRGQLVPHRLRLEAHRRHPSRPLSARSASARWLGGKRGESAQIRRGVRR